MAVCFDVTDGAHQETITRLSLYAQDKTGYERLMALSSYAYLDAEDGVPRIHKTLFGREDGRLDRADRRRTKVRSLGTFAAGQNRGCKSGVGQTLADASFRDDAMLRLRRHGSAEEMQM